MSKHYASYQWNDDELFDDYYEAFTRSLIEDNSIRTPISSNRKNLQDLLGPPNYVEEFQEATSKTNGASIALAISYGGRSGLFLADAHEKVFMESLNDMPKHDFDVVKIAHHGSSKNNYHWMKIISARHYLISTNGLEYEHPSLDVIAKILLYCKGRKELYFNYDIKDLKIMIDDKELKQKYLYDSHWGKSEIEV